MNKKFRFFLVRFLLLLIVIVFFFVIIEISFRIHATITNIDYRIYYHQLVNFDEIYPSNLFQHEPSPTTLTPLFQGVSSTYDFSVVYKINSQGLRDKEYAFERDFNMKRVLVLGDSLTFGHGITYEHRFTDIAENHFSNVEIINFGVPGYGFDQELLLFAYEGLKYSPDIVIVFFITFDADRQFTNIYNNGSINLKHANFSEFSSDDSTLFYHFDNQFKYQDNFLLRKSHFLSYASYKLNIFRLKRQLGAPSYLNNYAVANFTSYFPDKESHVPTVRNRTAAIVKEFSRIAEEKDIKLIFVNIDHNKESRPFLSQLREDILFNNVSYYDFGDELFEASSHQPVTFKYDSHLNEYANRIIAQEFIELLEKELE